MVAEPHGLSASYETAAVGATEQALGRVLARALIVVLATADVAMLSAAYVVTVSRVESYTADLRIPDPLRMLVWCTVLIAIWLPLATNFGAYDRRVVSSPLQSAYVIGKSTLIAGALFHIVPLVGGPVYSRFASMSVVLSIVAAMVIWRLAVSRVMPKTGVQDFVILGTGWEGGTLADAVRQHPQAGVRMLGFVSVDTLPPAQREHGLPVYPLNALRQLTVGREPPAGVVLALPEEAHASVYEQLTSLAQEGIQVRAMASVFEQVTGRVPVRHLGSFWWGMLPQPSSDLVYLGTKRIVDIGLSLLGLALLVLVLPFVWVWQQVESPGPLFFRQQRIGRKGGQLTLTKIRTLPHRSVSYADHWDRKRSSQLPRFAGFLRATGADELPQCWNVLKGEMSIVGPRPYVPEEVNDFQREIPFFRCRALVKPGLTGWAQVNWGYGLSLEDEVEKLQYDLYYVGHQCFWLDLLIMCRTLRLAFIRQRPKNAVSRIA